MDNRFLQNDRIRLRNDWHISFASREYNRMLDMLHGIHPPKNQQIPENRIIQHLRQGRERIVTKFHI